MTVVQPLASGPGSWRVYPFMHEFNSISHHYGYNGKLGNTLYPYNILASVLREWPIVTIDVES